MIHLEYSIKLNNWEKLIFEGLKNNMVPEKKHIVAFLAGSVLMVVFSMVFISCAGFDHDAGFTDRVFSPYDSRRIKIDACYIEELPTKGSPYYDLVEAEKLYNIRDYEKALGLVDLIVNDYSTKAREIQASLKEFPWESKKSVFSPIELNAVGSALLVKGLIHYQLNDFNKAEESLKILASGY